MLYILFLFLSAVKRHAIDAGSGCSQKTNPQHHVAAVSGLGAFCFLRRLVRLFGLGWVSRVCRVCRSSGVGGLFAGLVLCQEKVQIKYALFSVELPC